MTIMLIRHSCFGCCYVGLTLSPGLSSVPRSASEQVHKDLGEHSQEWAVPSPNRAKNHRMLFSVNQLGEVGQVLLIAAQEWAECWSVGGEKLNYEPLVSLGFYYYSLSF